MDDRLAARLHRRGTPVRHPRQGELQRQEDRRPLPERRLRQGLSVRVPCRRSARSTPTRTSSPRRRSRRPRRASTAQMVRMQASGAPVLVIFQIADADSSGRIATGKALGFNPQQIYMNSVAAIGSPGWTARSLPPERLTSTGRTRSSITRIPAGSEVGQRSCDEAVQADHREVRCRARTLNDGQVYYGVAKADAFVQALYKAGKNPTRAGS